MRFNSEFRLKESTFYIELFMMPGGDCGFGIAFAFLWIISDLWNHRVLRVSCDNCVRFVANNKILK